MLRGRSPGFGFAVGAALGVVLILVACGGSRELTGRWVATSENAEGTSFVFGDDGTVLWLLPDTFHLRYETDPGASPRTLDLSGFDRGPLQGYVLYCIYEFPEDERLRLDCEPGVPGERGSRIRPKTFGAVQTQTFVRRRRG